jgi:hypothetical protein
MQKNMLLPHVLKINNQVTYPFYKHFTKLSHLGHGECIPLARIGISKSWGKKTPGPQQGNFLEISKISSHFQESYEIAKIFGGFCQISSLFLLRLPY